MCQLNLYIIPKTVPVGEAIKIFKKSGLNISLETSYEIDALTEDYNLYSTNGHCNCNSVISNLQDDDSTSFNEYKIKRKREDIEKLNRMKVLKSTDDYDERLKKYVIERDRLWGIADDFRAYIHDFETEEFQKIQDLNLPGSEQVKMFDEVLVPKLKEMQNELEKNEEYQKAFNVYKDFSRQNSNLEESIYYDVEKYEEIVANYNFDNFYNEYSSLKNAFEEVLKLGEDVCVYPFWQDGEPMEIKDRRIVNIDSLDIDNLVFLSYRTLLVVKK